MSEQGNTDLRVSIRHLADEDRPFVRDTWRESYHNAASVRRMPWGLYKRTVGRQIDQLLSRDDVTVLAAYSDGDRVVGWIAYQPGRVATLLYVYTRYQLEDDKCRRRGVATALLESAELGTRVVYCFRGPKLNRGESMEGALVALAQRRGVSASYMPIEEFMR